MNLQLTKCVVHSHLSAIQLGNKTIGYVSKIDGGGWMWVYGEWKSNIDFATEKEAIDQLAATYIENGLDNMAMQHGLITQDEKLVKGFFDSKQNKKRV